MYTDKTLTCRECGAVFIFSGSEQAFYAEKGYQNLPGRCFACRTSHRQSTHGGNTRRRQMYDVICAECGATTQVPFQPRDDRPVYCPTCFARHFNR